MVRPGVAVAFISHRMAEITTVADEVTVLRNGRVVLDATGGTVSPHELITAMSGREIDVRFPTLAAPREEPALQVQHLSGQRWPRDVSLEVRAGEIVGLGGLDGQGQHQLLLCMYGLARARGAITVGRGPLRRWSPRGMRDLGVGFVPADRASEGLLQRNSIAFNIALPWLHSFSSWSLPQAPQLGRPSTTAPTNWRSLPTTTPGW